MAISPVMTNNNLTDVERIQIIKATLPDECALFTDTQLSLIVSNQVKVTLPEAGVHFDITPFIQLITAALGVLSAFTNYRATASARRDAAQPTTEEKELIAHARAIAEPGDGQQAADGQQLDHATTVRLAREYLRVVERKQKDNDSGDRAR